MPNGARLSFLATLRSEAGLTQAQAAAYFGLTKARHRRTFADWEAGRTAPPQHYRVNFLGYLWYRLLLRSNPAELLRLWQILEEEWRWPPISTAEWNQYIDTPPPQPPPPPATQDAPAMPGVEPAGAAGGAASAAPPRNRTLPRLGKLHWGAIATVSALLLAACGLIFQIVPTLTDETLPDQFYDQHSTLVGPVSDQRLSLSEEGVLRFDRSGSLMPEYEYYVAFGSDQAAALAALVASKVSPSTHDKRFLAELEKLRARLPDSDTAATVFGVENPTYVTWVRSMASRTTVSALLDLQVDFVAYAPFEGPAPAFFDNPLGGGGQAYRGEVTLDPAQVGIPFAVPLHLEGADYIPFAPGDEQLLEVKLRFAEPGSYTVRFGLVHTTLGEQKTAWSRTFTILVPPISYHQAFDKPVWRAIPFQPVKQAP